MNKDNYVKMFNMIRTVLEYDIGLLTADFFATGRLNETEIFSFSNHQISEFASDAFDHCFKLKKIVYIGTLEEYNSIKGKEAIPRKVQVHLFLDGDNETTEIEIPPSIERINDYCFYNCFRIDSIKFNGEDTSIGKYAFINCTSLMHIFLPYNLSVIEEGTFYNCESMEHIALPDTLERIEDIAFAQCSSLESIVVPHGVAKLGVGAFFNCTLLGSAVLGESITELKHDTFVECVSLKDIKIYGNLTSIEEGTFARAGEISRLRALIYYLGTFHSWLYMQGKKELGKTIGVHLHFDRSINEITRIDYSAPLIIPDYAFLDCVGLKEIYITEGITSIGNEAFSGCSNVHTLVIPNTVTKVGNKIFDWCYDLRIFFVGDEEESKQIFNKKNDIISFDLEELEIYIYSEEKPRKNGLYWHFNEDKVEIYH